jgi:hypothetical protein
LLWEFGNQCVAQTACDTEEGTCQGIELDCPGPGERYCAYATVWECGPDQTDEWAAEKCPLTYHDGQCRDDADPCLEVSIQNRGISLAVTAIETAGGDRNRLREGGSQAARSTIARPRFPAIASIAEFGM